LISLYYSCQTASSCGSTWSSYRPDLVLHGMSLPAWHMGCHSTCSSIFMPYYLTWQFGIALLLHFHDAYF